MVLTLTSEDFLNVVLALIVIRITRMNGRCANTRTALQSQFMKPGNLVGVHDNMLSLQPEWRRMSTPLSDHGFEIFVSQRSQDSCGFMLRRITKIDDEFMLGPLVLPLDPKLDTGRTDLCSTVLDPLGAHP